ncbi:MAG: ABC transporter permease [Acidobacteria bacterium]|nr:ABC transporter permease [Acidobacteriota bacterium]
MPLKYNIRNLLVRKGSTLVTAASIGLTVAVFLMVMALARGIDLTLASSGEPLNLIVLRNGTTAEMMSDVSRGNLDSLRFLDGIAREGDQPLVSPEVITLFYRARKGQTQGGNIIIRGIGPMSIRLRSGFKIVQGRMFQTGLPEAVVSRRISERFQGLEVGDKVRVQTTDYRVVGLFEADGKAFESEIWADVNVLRNTTRRLNYSSVLLRVESPETLASLAKRIGDDQRLQLKALPERSFYEEQQGPSSDILKGLGVFVSFIMAVGACFAGMNTMYAAVSHRTREIGTLRVLGFRRSSILIAFVLESVAVALLGVGIGVVLALPLNFVSTGTSNFINFSEIAFNFRVTPGLVLAAVIFGIGIGFFGSLLPSIRAARFKIVDALRST